MNQTVVKQTRGIILIKGLLLSYALTGIVLVILAFIMYKAEVSGVFVNTGVIFSYLISAFAGGFFVGKRTTEKKFLWGIILGLLYFSIIFAISFLMNKDILGNIGSMCIVLAICGFAGMLGGMLSS